MGLKPLGQDLGADLGRERLGVGTPWGGPQKPQVAVQGLSRDGADSVRQAS